jgi:hypothetical protein
MNLHRDVDPARLEDCAELIETTELSLCLVRTATAAGIEPRDHASPKMLHRKCFKILPLVSCLKTGSSGTWRCCCSGTAEHTLHAREHCQESRNRNWRVEITAAAVESDDSR